MNKIITMALITASFFLQAQQTIFDTTQFQAPKIDDGWSADCSSFAGDTTATGRGTATTEEIANTCAETQTDIISDYTSQAGQNICGSYTYIFKSAEIISGGVTVTYDCQHYYSNNKKTVTVNFTNYKEFNSKQCPPASNPLQTYSYDVDYDGEIDRCYNPADLSNNDSCNLQSGNQYIQNTVTTNSVCKTQNDGSICKYDAVSIDGNAQVYEMDLEGDCYSNPLPAPSSNENDLPDNNSCTSWSGSGVVCPEPYGDVCNENGCQKNCGMVNGQTYCFSADKDGDSVPDYLDPDIDGDGIPNNQDLDSDGDGVDDPIDNSNSGGSGSGGSGSGSGSGPVNVEIDTQGIIDAVNNLNDSVSKTDVQLSTEPTQGLEGFFESEYENGFTGIWTDKKSEFAQTDFLLFLDTLNPELGAGTEASMQMCFNLGFINFGCDSFVVDPRIWAAIRIFILVTAGFLCRRIIFGG